MSQDKGVDKNIALWYNMFEVSGVFENKEKFETVFGTEESVVGFIIKYKQFAELKILDVQDCRRRHIVDKTEYFIKKANE